MVLMMFYFQITWNSPELTGFQQNTLLRACLYNHNCPVHLHLFSQVDSGLQNTFISTPVDLTGLNFEHGRLILISNVEAPVELFTVHGLHKDMNYIKAIYDSKVESIDDIYLSGIKDSPYVKIRSCIARSKQRLVDLDMRKISSLVSVCAKEVLIQVKPDVSIRTVAKKLKLKSWGIV